MLRQILLGIATLVLVTAAGAGAQPPAQAKQMPQAGVKSINKSLVVDINAAPEADIIAVGIDRTIAKKIIEGRPWRNKRDLLTKEVLTKEQYDKFKNSLIAKRPKN